MLEKLFSSDGFMPHGHCYLWQPGILSLHIISDLLITLAYFSIPFTLIYFIRRRRDLPFNWMFLCFAVFIVACGATHLMEVWSIWYPTYWLSGTIKAITALASVPTAVLLARLVPHALALPSPSELRAAHEASQREMGERMKVEEKFRSLLEAAPDGMVIVDETGKVVLVNSQAELLFGYTRQELLGQPIEILIPQRFRERHPGFRDAFSAEPRTRAMGAGLELRGLRKDGTEFPVEISLSPLDTSEGRLVMSAIRDITYRKRIERDLHQRNLELQNAAEAKNRFLANMSHELRTPLNGIIGFSEFLVDEKPGSLNLKQKEYLGDVLHSAGHLLQLINDVLDLAKIEAGKMDVSPETFQIRQAIDEVRAVIQGAARKKQVSTVMNISPELGEVRLDQQKFKQVLYNLLSNGVKFSQPGSEVDITASAQEGRALRIEVTDRGIGIRREDLDRLFKEFEQLDAGEGRRFEGTGLGLALTKRLVELQGGSISVESQPGKGSTFTVLLPLSAADMNRKP
ncbi:MAG: PAS domain S-box protein [Verrucomicrobiales bacterium]|nr:PAS domain S-box protein [Verrucomicrobiales bacterium]